MDRIGETTEQDAVKGAGSVFTVRLLGIEWRVHLSVLLAFGIFLLGAFSGESTPVFWLGYGAGLFLSLIVHEAAHVLTARLVGLRTVRIFLFPIGGAEEFHEEPSPRQEWRVALAGPASNLLLAGGFALWLAQTGEGLTLADPEEGPVKAWMQLMAGGNIALGLLNLLPAWPLDGARILRSILQSIDPATWLARIVAAAGPMLILNLSVVAWIAERYMLALMGGFLFLSSLREVASIVGRRLVRGLMVENVMRRDFASIPHGTTVREALEAIKLSGQSHLPVLYAGKVLGMVSRPVLQRAAGANEANSYASGFMDRAFARAAPIDSLHSVLSLLYRRGALAVMDGENLLGILTTERLSSFFAGRRRSAA